MTDFQDVRTTRHEQGQEQRAVSFKATQLIWLLLGILETLIALRVVFKLIGVNASNSFATFLYGITHFFVAPFASLTGTPAVGSMVLEISSILAMIVYLLIAWALERIVYVFFYRPRGPVSIRQTIVSDHSPVQTATRTSQTTVTEPANTQPPNTL